MSMVQNHPKINPNITFTEAASHFLMECKIRNLTKESIRRYNNGLQKFRQHLEAQQLSLTTMNALDLTHKIIPGMMDEGLSLRTVNCNIFILRSFFRFLASEGWLETNIAANLKPFKVTQSLTHTFTDGHLQRLLAQPDRSTFTGIRNFVIMLVLLETGIRLKELANLRVTDILFEEESLLIHQGKGRKARVVPIQRTCAMELKFYLQERGTLDHNDLWVTLDNKPFETAGIKVMMSRYCSAAEIQGVQCSCHTFRHYVDPL